MAADWDRPRLETLQDNLGGSRHGDSDERSEDPAECCSDHDAHENDKRRQPQGVAHDDRHDDVRLG